MKMKEIELETEKSGFIFKFVLLIVSFIALLKNLAILMIEKIKQPKKLNKQLWWQIGRDPDHYSSTFVDKYSKYNRRGKVGAAGWRSLEIFYGYEDLKKKLKDDLEGKLTRYWIGKMSQRKAVSNRFKITKFLIQQAIDEKKDQKKIEILSLASGSADAVFSVILKNRSLPIKLTLIDLDESALKRAEENAKKYGIDDRIVTIKNSVSYVKELSKTKKFDIVEMVGFMDYKDIEYSVGLTKKIYNALRDNGVYITCNIKKSIEYPFLLWVLMWPPMLMKDEEDLKKIVSKSGFKEYNIITEPQNIHALIYCKK